MSSNTNLPEHVQARVAALGRYQILDSPPEAAFDDFTRVAAHLSGTPIALITLLDESRQWFKSRVGLEQSETPIEQAFCTHAIASDGILEVPDARRDKRFRENPLVTGPTAIRFYAGAPLRTTEGIGLGTLCVLDRKPRRLSAVQKETLALLARQVMNQLELRVAGWRLQEREAQFSDIFEGTSDLIQSVSPDGRILLVNRAWRETLGYGEEELADLNIFDVIHPDSREHCRGVFARLAAGDEVGDVQVTLRTKAGQPVILEGRISMAFEHGRPVRTRGIFRDDSERARRLDELRRNEERWRQFNQVTREAVAFHRCGILIDVNPACARLCGYAAEELVGKPVTQLCAPESEATVARHAGSEELVTYEVTARRKDGGTFRAEITSGPAPFRGDDVRFATVRDVTRQFEAVELVREENKDLEQLVAERTASLRESEMLFRLMVTSVRDYAIFMLDPEGRVANWYPGAEMVKGYTEREIIGRHFSIFYPEASRAAGLPEKLLATARREGRASDEGWRVRKDGTRFWADVVITAMRDEEGNLRGFSKVTQDITERRRAAMANAELAQALRSIRESVCITDLEHRIRFVNDSLLRCYGYSKEELVGRRVEILRAPETSAETVRDIEAAAASTGWTGELLNRRKDGAVFPIFLVTSPVRDANGKVIAFVGVGTDLSEMKRAAAETRRKEVMLRAVLENLAEGVVACDAGGRLTFFNKTARDWHGADVMSVPPEEWPALFDLFEGDAATPLAPERIPLVRALNGEHVRNVDMAIVAKGREPRLIVASGDPLYDDDGRKQGAVVVMHDITERKRGETLMLRAQRVESIGTLAGGIAHDLNNALAPVLMVAELMRMKYPEARDMIDTVESSAQRGAQMVRQLLTYAKGVEGERLLVESRPLFAEIEKMVRGTFPKSIQVRVDCAKDLAAVRGDATQLHQVLLNLAVNARDAMPNGGRLTLAARVVDLDEEFVRREPDARPGRFVEWRVSDTGTGIPPEVMERIFEPFFSTKGPDKGTGLGLSTLLGIVRSHEGFVLVKSATGKGTEFSVYLPVADGGEAAARGPAVDLPPLQGRGETILVVDDELSVRNAARSVLEALGFHVITAAEGASALVEVAQNREKLKLVVTDLDMPQMDGLQLARVLRHMLPGAAIVVASGRLTEEHAAEFSELGVAARLDKPYTQQQLVTVLRRVFQT